MRRLWLIALFSFLGTEAYASDVYVFPRQNQTMEQQSMDAGTCRQWAMRQTGVDPTYVQGQMAMMQNQYGYQRQEMPVARHALRGVAAGAIMGEIHKEMDPGAGRGAAMGLTAGAMHGMRQKRDMMMQEEAQRTQQQMQQLQGRHNSYVRAYSACMDAKGYSVS